MLRAKVEIGQTSEMPDKTLTAHNRWTKYHNSAFDRSNLLMTNLIEQNHILIFIIRAK